MGRPAGDTAGDMSDAGGWEREHDGKGEEGNSKADRKTRRRARRAGRWAANGQRSIESSEVSS
jgi:hypothetical protein